MKKHILLISLLFLSCTPNSNAGETIVTDETETYFYADGKMEKSNGQFEITYYIEDDKITRTRVFDKNKKEDIPDDTAYILQKQLSSDPSNKFHINGVDKDVIRAIGQPGLDAVEILVIQKDFVQSCKSTSDYFVITRAKRIK